MNVYDDLKIVIKSILDESSEQINLLNSQLKTIATKLEPLRIKIDVEVDESIRDIVKNIKEVQKQASGGLQLGVAETTDETQRMIRATQVYSHTLDAVVKQVSEYRDSLIRTRQEIEQYNRETQQLEHTLTVTTLNYEKQIKAQEEVSRRIQKLLTQIELLRNQYPYGDFRGIDEFVQKLDVNKIDLSNYQQQLNGLENEYKLLAEAVKNSSREFEGLLSAEQVVQREIDNLRVRIELLKKQFSLADFSELDAFAEKLDVSKIDLSNYKQQLNDIKNEFKLIEDAAKRSHKVQEEQIALTEKEKLIREEISRALQGLWTDVELLRRRYPLADFSELDKFVEKLDISKIDLSNYKNQLNEIRNEYQLIADAIQRSHRATEARLKLEEQIVIFRKKYELEVAKLQRDYEGLYDEKAVADFLDELQNLSANVPDAEKRMKQLALRFAEIKTAAQTSQEALDLSNRKAITFGKAFETALEKFAIWMGATTLFYQTLRFFQNGIEYVNELNKVLTEISIVTGQTQAQVALLAKEYQNLAKQMGVTTEDIAKGAVEFYRQGLTQEEVMERLRVTTMAAKISAQDFRTTAELLTATVNSMNVSIERASDVFAYLGDATATSYEEIATGFQKVGGTAGALGVEFERVASWIAVVSSRTRESAESIGYAFNTILARMSQLKEQGYTEEDNTSINDVAKALDAVGIKLTDAAGNFRNFGIIIDELGKKWNTLDERTKAYLATTIAGTRQQSRFYNLMEGYDEALRLYEGALNAAGTTQQKYNLYLQSTEAHLNRLRTTATGIWQDVFDSQKIRDTIDALTVFVELAGKVINMFGLFPTALGTIAGLLSLVHHRWSLLNIELVKTKETTEWKFTGFLGPLIQALRQLDIQAAAATAKLIGLRLASMALAGVVTTFVTAGIQFLVTWIIKLINYQEEIRRKREETIYTLNQEIDKIRNERQELTSLLEEYKRLTVLGEDTTNVRNKIAQLAPELVQGWTAEGNAILKTNDEIERYLNNLVQIEAQKQKAKALLNIKSLEEQREELERLNKQIEYFNVMLQRASGEFVSATYSDIAKFGWDIVGKYGTAWKTSELKAKIAEINTAKDAAKSSIKEIIQQFWAVSSEYQRLSGVSKKVAEDLFESFTANFGEITQENLDKYLNKLDEIAKTIQELNLEQEYKAYSELIQKYNEGTIALAELEAQYRKIRDILQQLGVTDITKFLQTPQQLQQQIDILDRLADSQRVLNDLYENSLGDLKQLNQAYADIVEGQALSADTVAELILKYPELATAIKATADGYTIEIKALEQVRQAKIQEQIITLNAEKDKAKAVLDNARTRLQAYGVEVEAIKSLADAQRLAANLKAPTVPSYIDYLPSQYRAYILQSIEQQSKDVENLKNVLIEYGKIVSQINTLQSLLGKMGVSVSKSSSSTGKISEAVRKFLESLEYIDAVVEFNHRLNQLNQEYAELTGSTNELIRLKVQEKNIYKEINAIYANNIQKIKSQMAKYATTSEEYKNLEDALREYTLAIKENEIAIENIDIALEEHDKTLRDKVIEAENLVLEAVRNRAKKQYEIERKALDERIALLEREKQLLREEYNKRRENKEQEDLQQKLLQVQEEYNRIAIDNSGMYEKRKQELVKEMLELQEQIYEKSLEKQLNDKERAIDEEINKLQQERDALEAHFQELEESYTQYWLDVENIMQMSQDKIIQFLIDNTEEYKRAGELQKEAYLEGWGELFKEAKQIQAGTMKDSGTIAKEVGTSTGISGGITSKPSMGGGTSSTTSAYPGASLKQGSRGEHVKLVQQRLKELGYAVGTVDGIFGSQTAAAVKAFQRDYGLTVDAIVGPATWQALFANITSRGDSRYTGQYADIINEAARKYGLDPKLIAAVIQAESGFNPNAKSSAGAVGLMQLMPATAKELGVTNLYDPYQNIMGGAKYLSQQLKRFGSIEKALAAYNWGPGNVLKNNTWPNSVQNYINKVKQYMKQYKEGGLVDYTGLALVHGSKSKPEAFLNPEQTEIINKFAQSLERFAKTDRLILGNNYLVKQPVATGNIQLTTNINVYAEVNNGYDAQQLGRDIAKGIQEQFEGLRRKIGLNLPVFGTR